MKVYINIDSLSIIRIEREKPFYQGSNFVDRMRVLFNGLNETFSPTAMFKLPTGRRVGPVHPIGIDEGTTRLINEDGKVWYYYDFIISADIGLLAHPGPLEASIVLNYCNANSIIVKQAVIGNIVNEIVKTTVYGEGNIIVVGEDPEVILNNLNTTITTLSNRQTTIEATWTNVVSKLVPVIKNLLVDSKDTRIEFWDDEIKIIHAGKLVATFDNEEGIIVKGGIEGTDLSLSGDIFAASSTAQARFNQIDFKDGVGENLIVDDIRSLDGHINDTLHVGNEIYLGDIEVNSSIKSIKSILHRLTSIIVDQLDEEAASIRFSDNSIIVEHLNEELARFSSNDGIYFNSSVDFKDTIEARKDIFLKGESLISLLNALQAKYEDAKTYTYRKIEQEVKDRNAAIEALKASLIDGAPQALDTLLELSIALGNDPNFATTITNLINQKFSDSKNYADDNFVRSEELFDLLSHLNETDLENVFKGVYNELN